MMKGSNLMNAPHAGVISSYPAYSESPAFAFASPEPPWTTGGEETGVVHIGQPAPKVGRARILVIDDDPAVTRLFKRGLTYEGYIVDVAESGEVGLASANRCEPDLVLLDIMMPGLDGLEVLRRLRAADPDLPVLLTTARDAPEEQVRGLDAGADDYVTKPFTFEVVVARIGALLRRKQREQTTVMRFADLIMDTGSHTVCRGQRTITLTSLEFKLLQEFMIHPRQVLAKDVLLDRVWSYNFGGNANVTEVYVMQLRQKLEANGEGRLIHTLRGVGYVLREE